MESRQQLAPIEGERISRSAVVYGRIKRPDVTSDLLRPEGQLFVAAGDDRLRSQGSAQEIDRLPERVPGLLGILLRPEEGKKSIPAVKAAGQGKSEIAQEGGASGLRENGTDGRVIGRGQLQSAQRTQVDHSIVRQG